MNGNICIFGAGAIGSEIGGKLARAGEKVTLVGRGAHLAAMQTHGLRLIENGEEMARLPVTATSSPDTLPVQDLIIISLKAHALTDAAPAIAALCHEKTELLFAINGLPWWYFYRHGGKYDGHRLRSLDAEGIIWNTLDPSRVIGCANYLAATVTAPGEVSFVKNAISELHIGEPDGSDSPRCKALAGRLSRAGIPTHIHLTIREKIWHKLWGNIAFNPITALTHATMDAVVKEYHDTDLIEAIMNEARFVAEKIGITFPQGPAGRIAQASSMIGHKTSMLQDIEAGKPTEIEAIVGAVREIGQMVGAETPHLNGLYSLVRLKEKFFRPAAG